MVTPSSRAYDGFACGDAMITTLLESVEIHGVVILVVDDLTSPYDIPSVLRRLDVSKGFVSHAVRVPGYIRIGASRSLGFYYSRGLRPPGS